VLSTLFDNFQMPQRSHATFSESSNILEDKISFDFEAGETFERRLEREKRARESLEQKFQQLQSKFEATHEEIKRKNQTDAGIPSKNDVDFLLNTVRNWQASQDQEKERRNSLEQKLEKHRRELEEEKRGHQADIHRFEREKEREMQELKSGFE
jgi:chromosome segregation ATPase